MPRSKSELAIRFPPADGISCAALNPLQIALALSAKPISVTKTAFGIRQRLKQSCLSSIMGSTPPECPTLAESFPYSSPVSVRMADPLMRIHPHLPEANNYWRALSQTPPAVGRKPVSPEGDRPPLRVGEESPPAPPPTFPSPPLS